MAQVSLSGVVSGLDTASIINQLVSVQKNQQTLLKNQQTGAQAAADAYKGLISALSSLGTQAREVAKTSSWQGTTGSSSSAGVTVAASGTRPASLAFDVTSVAAAHALVSTDHVASLTTKVASGSITLTRQDGSTLAVPVGGGSLTEVVDALNDSGEPLVASVVQTSPGQYRLQVSATSTGAASDFSLAGLDAFAGAGGFTGMGVLRTGTDAVVRVGTDPATAFDVRSSTNTFADVVPGLSFTVSKVETGVTIGSTVDGTAMADKVSKLVDSANALLADIAKKTAWNSSTKTGGPLVGDSTARALQQAILGTAGGGGAAGVSLTRDGRLSFDRAAFTTAFTADPAAVARGYGATTSFTAAAGVTSKVGLVRAADTVRSGSYGVVVTQAAAGEQWSAALPGGVDGRTLSLTRGTTTVSYTGAPGATLAQAAALMADSLADAGLDVDVSVAGTDLVFTAKATGTASAFSLTLDAVAATRVRAGLDVAGFIDGEPATGTGSVLALQEGTGSAVGLSLDVPVTAAEVTATGGVVGSFGYTPGLAQRLLTLVNDVTKSSTGALASAQQSRLSAVKGYQSQIDRWDQRLTTYREMLTRQFTAMETALASLKSQTSFLAGMSTSMLGGKDSSS